MKSSGVIISKPSVEDDGAAKGGGNIFVFGRARVGNISVFGRAEVSNISVFEAGR